MPFPDRVFGGANHNRKILRTNGESIHFVPVSRQHRIDLVNAGTPELVQLLGYLGMPGQTGLIDAHAHATVHLRTICAH